MTLHSQITQLSWSKSLHKHELFWSSFPTIEISLHQFACSLVYCRAPKFKVSAPTISSFTPQQATSLVCGRRKICAIESKWIHVTLLLCIAQFRPAWPGVITMVKTSEGTSEQISTTISAHHTRVSTFKQVRCPVRTRESMLTEIRQSRRVLSWNRQELPKIRDGDAKISPQIHNNDIGIPVVKWSCDEWSFCSNDKRPGKCGWNETKAAQKMVKRV